MTDRNDKTYAEATRLIRGAEHPDRSLRRVPDARQSERDRPRNRESYERRPLRVGVQTANPQHNPKGIAMTFETARAYIEISRREQRRRRAAILATLGISVALWTGITAIGWSVWSILP
jgi:hypothetical protein